VARALAIDLAAYRIPLWGEPDPRWRRCTAIAAVLGALTLVAVYVTPRRAVEITSVDQVSDRLAKLILEEPAPPAPPAAKPKARIETPPPPEPVAQAEPEPAPKPIEKAPTPAPRPRSEPKVPENLGSAGREQAKEQTKQLADVTKQLSGVLADVTSSLSAETKAATQESTRRRRTRSGRSASQLASVAAPLPVVDPSAASSRLEGTGLVIESIEAIAATPDADAGSRGKATRSQARSDAQLLTVVRKYAPGIQYCYDNELKRAPGLGGKLLVSITVTAAGRVTDAAVVQDTVRSSELARCALAQIEAWKFPPVESGVVTFQAPFVFTPPE